MLIARLRRARNQPPATARTTANRAHAHQNRTAPAGAPRRSSKRRCRAARTRKPRKGLGRPSRTLPRRVRIRARLPSANRRGGNASPQRFVSGRLLPGAPRKIALSCGDFRGASRGAPIFARRSLTAAARSRARFAHSAPRAGRNPPSAFAKRPRGASRRFFRPSPPPPKARLRRALAEPAIARGGRKKTAGFGCAQKPRASGKCAAFRCEGSGGLRPKNQKKERGANRPPRGRESGCRRAAEPRARSPPRTNRAAGRVPQPRSTPQIATSAVRVGRGPAAVARKHHAHSAVSAVGFS